MKITVTKQPVNNSRPNVYLARRKDSGTLCIVGRYNAITLEDGDEGKAGNAGNAWGSGCELFKYHDMFMPLSPEETVTLKNE